MNLAKLLDAADEDGVRHLVLVAVSDLAAATDAVRELRSASAPADGFALLLALDASSQGAPGGAPVPG